ncbi:MAG TPA: glycosyltransferase [Gemmataceae bacterium]|nr:glycosyltransferase [Gemmataceae bacterium]
MSANTSPLAPVLRGEGLGVRGCVCAQAQCNPSPSPQPLSPEGRGALSIVIPSHNRPDLLRACLAGVTRHAPAGTEILVIDDGSPGGSVSAAASEVAHVRCLRSPRRRGFCAAANAGIVAATAPIVELLNDDTEVEAGWAAAALGHFSDPRVAAVAPLVLRWAAAGEAAPIDSAGDRYFRGGVAGKRGHGEPVGPAYLRPCRVFGASASSAFYRRDLLLRVGAFPERFGAYFEDVDLSFRLHRAGGEVVFEPASRVRHRVSASHGRPRHRLLEQQSRNEELVFWRNLPAAELARSLPLHLAVLAAKAWRRWGEGNLAPFLAGRLSVLAQLPAIVRQRRLLRELGPQDDVTRWGVERHFWGTTRKR